MPEAADDPAVLPAAPVETAAPAAAPVVVETVAPALVETAAPAETPAAVPVPDTAAAAEPDKKPDEAAKPPEHPKSLLAKFDEERAAKEAADKAGKKPGEEPAKPAETTEKPAEPAEDAPLAFELPANFKAAPEQLEEFGSLLKSTRSGDLKEAGQKLIGMHAKAMEAYAKDVADHQWKVWNDMIEQKDKEILADPILGGAGHRTVAAAVARMRDLFVPEERRASFTTFMNVTGAGSWPDFWHMLHTAARYFDEPPIPAPGGRPPKDAHLSGSGGRFGLLHDHPSSQGRS
jgi:hypothetical protein